MPSFFIWAFFILFLVIMNWVFTTNSDFRILISLQSIFLYLRYFQAMNSFIWSNNIILKYQRFTPTGCIDLGIRKLEFVEKIQFLFLLSYTCMLYMLKYIYVYIYICIYKLPWIGKIKWNYFSLNAIYSFSTLETQKYKKYIFLTISPCSRYLKKKVKRGDIYGPINWLTVRIYIIKIYLLT